MDNQLIYGVNTETELFESIFRFNTLQDYLSSAVILLFGILVVKVIQVVFARKVTNGSVSAARFVIEIAKFIYPILFALIVYAAFHWLTVSAQVAQYSGYFFKIVFVLLTMRLITGIVRSSVYSYLNQQHDAGSKLKQIRGIVIVVNSVLWAIGLIFLFDNLGFNVSAILTGLGIGGIAIALAAQTILGDIFNYFVIFFDRPFEIGDFIVIDDKMGTVEYIGLKTTRLKSLSGEQIILSNGNLTNSRVHNYKRMHERRILFRFGVAYHTPVEKVERIPKMIEGIVNQLPATRFDRAHFASLGNYSLEFEVVYFILSPDYNDYMDTQQRINIELWNAFAHEEILFAFPTYSIHIGSTINSRQGGSYPVMNAHLNNT